MKGKIDDTGALSILRGDDYKIQLCPWGLDPQRSTNIRCGDWCPLFGEPIYHFFQNEKGDDQQGVMLPVCKKRLIFDDFSDER